jgi:hypothetical protein
MPIHNGDDDSLYNTDQLAQQINTSNVQQMSMLAATVDEDDSMYNLEEEELERQIGTVGGADDVAQQNTVMQRVNVAPPRPPRPYPPPQAPRQPPAPPKIHTPAEVRSMSVNQIDKATQRPQNTPDGLHHLNEQKYRMEALDPKHRMGDLLMYCFNIYQRIKPQAPFFQWLDSMSYFEVCKHIKQYRMGQLADQGMYEHHARPKADEDVRRLAPMFVKSVKYLDGRTRATYRVHVDGGALKWRNKTFDTVKLNRETVFSGIGWAMWVLSANKAVYTNSHILGESHHSGFLSGGVVKGAGEWKVADGRVEFITGKTGHYKCDLNSLRESIKTMQGLGISFTNAKVVVWDQMTDEPAAFPVSDLLNSYTLDVKYKAYGKKPLTDVVKHKRASETMGAIGSHRTKKAAAPPPPPQSAKPKRPLGQPGT